MPIDIQQFEGEPASERRPPGGEPTNFDLILAFLSSRPDSAFTPTEIRAETGVPRGSVCVVLSKLEDRGQVRHRGEYWTVTGATRDVAVR